MVQMQQLDDKELQQCRFNELVEELNSCREDERSGQSHIFEVISVSCTVLGLLFSASYLNPDKMNEKITIFRI